MTKLIFVQVDLSSDFILSEFWNADSALWAQVLKKNQLSKLIISDKSEMGMKTDMEVAMSMPMGMSMGFPTEVTVKNRYESSIKCFCYWIFFNLSVQPYI
jgi:hypothetical protein